MNTTIWILQGVLALAFFMAGVMKIIMPKEKLGKMMPWANEYSAGMVKFIGLSELVAAAGLIVPLLTGIAIYLTPLAASGLCLIMLLAMAHHLRRSENKEVLINAILFILAAAVVYYRFKY